MVTNHPTINETIDAILIVIQSGRWYAFGELWGPAYKFIPGENKNLDSIKLNRCLRKMLEEDLVKVIPEKNIPFDISTADWNTKVTLEERGDEIKESGGWIKYIADNSELKRLQVAELRAQKGRFRLTTGLAIALVLAAVFALYQTHRTNTIGQELKAMTQQRDSILTVTRDCRNLSETKDKELQKLTLKIDSLLKSIKN